MPFCTAPCKARPSAPCRAIPLQADTTALHGAPRQAAIAALLLTSAGYGERARPYGQMEANGQKGGYGWGYMVSPLISPPCLTIKRLSTADFPETRSVGRTARQIWLSKNSVLERKELRASFDERSASGECFSPTNGAAIFVGRSAFWNWQDAVGFFKLQQTRRNIRPTERVRFRASS